MKTARALTVLVVACVVGAGLGLTAHAVTRDDASPQRDARPAADATSAPTTPTAAQRTPSASLTSTTSSDSSSATTSSRQQSLSLRNVFTAADLREAGFQITPGRYDQGDANELQYAQTPCMRDSLGRLTGANAYVAEAYGDRNAFLNEAASEMVNETQARTVARTLISWHTGRCPNGPTFTADETRRIDGGTLWTFLSDDGDVVGIVQVGARLALAHVNGEPSAATTQKVIDAAIERLTTPAR